MGRGTDLTGCRFGKLTVLEKLTATQDRYCLWRCRCDCGGEILVNTKRLTRGTVTDCGCVPKTDACNGPRAEDLTGRRFGLLTVLERAENKNGRACWLCRCDCGALHRVAARDLKAGKVTSCGCRRGWGQTGVDLTGQRFGRLTALYATSQRDKKGSIYWHCRCDCGAEIDVTEDSLIQGNSRSCGCLKREAQQAISTRLHRVDGTCVEWLEHRKHRSDNTSGFRGVCRLKNGRYRAFIGFKGQRYNIGSYDSFEAAVAARLEAEELIHDGFVKAWRQWKASDTGQGPALPLEFTVKKQNGTLVVQTNMEL